MALAQPGCFVCRKHRDRGSRMRAGPVAEDDLVVDEWPEARRGDAAAIAAFVYELRASLAVAGHPASVRPSKST